MLGAKQKRGFQRIKYASEKLQSNDPSVNVFLASLQLGAILRNIQIVISCKVEKLNYGAF